jgi:hypothetical protein
VGQFSERGSEKFVLGFIAASVIPGVLAQGPMRGRLATDRRVRLGHNIAVAFALAAVLFSNFTTG